jgi:Nitrous oxide-stimulated promoter
MNATVSTVGPLPTNRFSHRRLAREWKTVTAMVHIYCREQHGNSLCAECQGLMRYISLRLDHCRFGADKPTCAKCPVHCYQRDRREQVKDVMRFAGPRMLWEHPWLSVCHLLDGWFRRAER